MSKKTEKLVELALIDLDNNELQKALRQINEALNREPGHQLALRTKATIKLETETPEEARDFLIFALQQCPNDDRLHQMLGSFYHQHNEYDKAGEQFDKALDINDANATAHRGAGMINAQHLSNHQEAISHFSKAIEYDEGNADNYFNRGCSHLILDHPKKAKEDLEKAKQKGKDEADNMLNDYF